MKMLLDLLPLIAKCASQYGPEYAADAFQEACLACVQTYGDYDGSGTYRAFALKIAKQAMDKYMRDENEFNNVCIPKRSR